MKQFVLAFIFVVLFGFSIYAQTPSARLVDRYQAVQHRIRKERLDQFAIELQNDPNARGLIAVTANKQKSRQAKSFLTRIYNYLVNSRGLDPERLLFTVFKDEDDAEYAELHLIPAGAEPPQLPKQQKIIEGDNLIKKPISKPKPKTKRKTRG